MKILVISDQTFNELQVFAKELGYDLQISSPKNLIIRAGRNNFDPTLKGQPMHVYDVIYLHNLSTFHQEWQAAAYVLTQKHKSKIINQEHHATALDFYTEFRNNMPFPSSVIIFNPKSLDSVIENFDFPIFINSNFINKKN